MCFKTSNFQNFDQTIYNFRQKFYCFLGQVRDIPILSKNGGNCMTVIIKFILEKQSFSIRKTEIFGGQFQAPPAQFFQLWGSSCQTSVITRCSSRGNLSQEYVIIYSTEIKKKILKLKIIKLLYLFELPPESGNK